MTELKFGTRKKIPAKVGMMSLVGVRKERPSYWGNYFSFDDGRYASREELTARINEPELRCVNMWAEDLQALAKSVLEDGLVEVVIFEEERVQIGDRLKRWVVVDDPRIPKGPVNRYYWYHNKFCWTGHYYPSRDIAEEMYSIHGDPDREILRWDDPFWYYARNGGYLDKNGTVIESFTNASPLHTRAMCLREMEKIDMVKAKAMVDAWRDQPCPKGLV